MAERLRKESPMFIEKRKGRAKVADTVMNVVMRVEGYDISGPDSSLGIAKAPFL